MTLTKSDVFVWRCRNADTGDWEDVEIPWTETPRAHSFEWRGQEYDRRGELLGRAEPPMAKELRKLTGSFEVGKRHTSKPARDRRGNLQGNDSLPRNWKYAEKFDSKGRVVFDSNRERDEAHARAAAAGELLTPRELSAPGSKRGLQIDEG